MSGPLWAALRRIVRSRVHSTATVLLLGLGIGTLVAVLATVDRAVVRPVAVEGLDQLVSLGRSILSYPDYRELADRSTTLLGIAAYAPVNLSLQVGGEAQEVRGQLVTRNYFSVLGVRLHLGQGFTESGDPETSGELVGVLGEGLWRRQFGADPEILGQVVTINGQAVVVLGVAPRRFRGTDLEYAPEVWLPLDRESSIRPNLAPYKLLERREVRWLSAVGRLGRGVAPGAAEDELGSLLQSAASGSPGREAPLAVERLQVAAIPQSVRSQIQAGAQLLVTAAILVVLIVASNLALLGLVRTQSRNRELGIELCLGAPRRRLAQGILVENLVLSVCGTVLGLGLATGILRFLEAGRWTRFIPIAVDPALQPASAGLALLLGLALTGGSGLFVTARAMRLQPVLCLAGRDDPAARSGRLGYLDLSVGAQLALSTALLVSCALIISALGETRALDPGFDSERLVLLRADPSIAGRSPADAELFRRSVLAQVETLPGVDSASWAAVTPAGGVDLVWDVERSPGSGDGSLRVSGNLVDGRYFETLGIPVEMTAGRERPFVGADSESEVVVNRALARRLWGGSEQMPPAVVLQGPFGPQSLAVAGVASDVISQVLNDRGKPFLYLPLEASGQTGGILHVRTDAPVGEIASELRRIVSVVDPGVPVSELTTMNQHLEVVLSQPRAVAIVLGVYGLLGTVLTGIGTFSTVSYRLGRRARDIGIRLALGGSRGSVFHAAMRSTALTSLAGLAGGLVGGLLLGRILIFRVPGLEPPELTLAWGVTAFLALLVATAGATPTILSLARDPLLSIRAEN